MINQSPSIDQGWKKTLYKKVVWVVIMVIGKA
jgi:hypothetical protein